MKKVIILTVLLMCVFTFTGAAASATTDADWEKVKVSFYMAADGKTLCRDLPEVAAVKNLERWANDGGLPKNIATMYYTDTTSSKESFINFAKRLKAGGTIRQELKNPGKYYGEVVHNSKLYGYYYSKSENGKLQIGYRATAKNPETFYNHSRTIRLTDKIKQQLIDAKLNIKETTAKHVVLEGLAEGVLYADKNTECFVPFYNDGMYEFAKGGQAYTTAQIADLMLANVETIFPPIVDDEENKTDSP